MNLADIKEIINNPVLPDPTKETMIIMSLSQDPKIIPDILQILNQERIFTNGLITEMNLELSRAHIFIDDLEFENVKKETKRSGSFTQTFVLDKIAEFYIKYKNNIRHCFNRFNP